MALVRYGGGISEMSGSIAGTVFAHNRFGHYARNRTKPTNPNTDAQAKIRACIAYLTEYWADTLDAAQRTAWALYAKNVGMKNRLGETIKLSGMNHFIRSNSARLYNDWNILLDGPTDFTLPEKDQTLTIDVDEAPQVIAVTFNDQLAWNKETGGFLVMYQGLPQNGHRNFFAGPWHTNGILEGSSLNGPASPRNFTPYYPVALGQRQWCKFRTARADGRLSEPWQVSAIVHGHAPGEGEGEGEGENP